MQAAKAFCTVVFGWWHPRHFPLPAAGSFAFLFAWRNELISGGCVHTMSWRVVLLRGAADSSVSATGWSSHMENSVDTQKS
eukprot:4333415-Amphidinium_carterae.1